MTVKIQVELSPEESEELRKSVSAGDQLRIREMLARAVEPTVVALLQKGTEEESGPRSFEDLTDDLISLLEGMRGDAPPLPAEALTRENLYRDRL